MVAGASFYAWTVRSPSVVASLLSPLSRSNTKVSKRLEAAQQSWRDDSVLLQLDTGAAHSDSVKPDVTSVVPQTQTYAYPGGGITVRLQVNEIASELYRVSPYVSTLESCTIVFSGFLSNLSELSAEYASKGKVKSPTARSNSANQFGVERLERKSSIERSLDVGAATANVVLQAYLEHNTGSEQLIMLSELQGQFAFVIYDGHRKQAFAARDPSGLEELYYHVDDDGGVAFASAPMEVAGAEHVHEWLELPPGHYITTSGRAPKLCQFALTPRQLQVRSQQEAEECASLSSSCEDFSMSPRRSLDPGVSGTCALPMTLKPGKSQEAEVFNLDL